MIFYPKNIGLIFLFFIVYEHVFNDFMTILSCELCGRPCARNYSPSGGRRGVAINLRRNRNVWFGAFLASGFVYGLKRILTFHSPILVGVCVLSTYGIGYVLAVRALGIPLPGSINRLFSKP